MRRAWFYQDRIVYNMIMRSAYLVANVNYSYSHVKYRAYSNSTQASLLYSLIVNNLFRAPISLQLRVRKKHDMLLV